MTDGCAIDALIAVTGEIPERNIALMRGTQLTTPLGRHPDFRSVAELYQRAAKNVSTPVGKKLNQMKMSATRAVPDEIIAMTNQGKQVVVDIPEMRHMAKLAPKPGGELFIQNNGEEGEDVGLIFDRKYRVFVFEEKK